MGLSRSVIGGVAGGVVGAAAMLPLFEGARRLGLIRESPPARVIDRAAATAGQATEIGGPVDQDERTVTSIGSHMLYGAAAGAIYGLVQDELKLPADPGGMAYGIALWTAGYIGWLPALGVLHRPWQQRTGDALVPFAAHLAFGLALGRVDAAVRQA